MTEQEIREMPAGREIDLLIGKYVMHELYVEPPAWSVDIALAWEVVERLRSEDKPLAVIPRDNDWLVGSAKALPIWRLVSMAAETAPLAICRAALLAVGA